MVPSNVVKLPVTRRRGALSSAPCVLGPNVSFSFPLYRGRDVTQGAGQTGGGWLEEGRPILQAAVLC